MSIAIRQEGSREWCAEIPVLLDVSRVVLPERPAFPVSVWLSYSTIASWHRAELWSEPYWRLLAAYARDMAAHRLSVMTVPLESIRLYVEPGGFRFDFSAFDRWVDVFTRAGIGQRIEMMHLASREHGVWDDKRFVFRAFTAVNERTGDAVPVPAPRFATEIEKHLAAKGWLSRAMAHVADEPAPFNVASWREISRQVRGVAPRVRRIEAIWVPPEDVAGDLETMVPLLNLLDQWQPRFRTAQQSGVEVWSYVCWLPQGKYPNRLLDHAAVEARLLPWVALSLGATGYLQWGYNYWTRDLAEMRLAPGDDWIVYPGAAGPRSSLRWEALRDGIEDVDLLCMLRSRDPEGAEAFVREVVRSGTDYETDPSRLERVRRRLLALLAAPAGR